MPSARGTEAPTARRLRRARAEGDHPISRGLLALGAVAGAALLLPFTVRGLLGDARALLELALNEPSQADPMVLARLVLWRAVPLVLASALGALCIGLWQTGAMVTFAPLAWNWQRTSPFGALERANLGPRLFGASQLAIGSALLCFVGYRVLYQAGPSLLNGIGDASASASLAAVLCERLLVWALVVMTALAVADRVVTHASWYRRQYMTRDELKREQRESEGDPGLKQARQRAHQELLQQADLGQLGAATLLVVGRRRLATALRYDPARDAAPRVLIQANGALAVTLEALAGERGISVWNDAALARELSGLAVDEEIPSAHYAAVAEALKLAPAGVLPDARRPTR
jgi:flagellar biosynthesis protein FlhB